MLVVDIFKADKLRGAREVELVEVGGSGEPPGRTDHHAPAVGYALGHVRAGVPGCGTVF